jgi:hypothetical protein
MKRAPDWRQVHHTMTFLIGVVLCLAAIVIYLWSTNFVLATDVARAVRTIAIGRQLITSWKKQ